jgi:hypothetical protein
MIFRKLKIKTRTILIIQCIGMFMGTSTHLLWLVKHGFLSEKYKAPLFSMIFWDSLTFLDPLAAVLLIFKPKIGLYLTLLIITVDVLHNNAFYFKEIYFSPLGILDWIKAYWQLICQFVFAVFVYITFRSNLKEIKLKFLSSE